VEENKVIQIVKASPRPSSTSTPAGTSEAKKAAQMILSCYPDYGKAPPEYIVNLIDVLSTYPSHVLVRLVDLRTGIVAKSSYLPAIADVVALADSYSEVLEDERLARLTEERREQERKRGEELLSKARKTHPTAFLDVNGMLRYFPEVEAGAKATERQLEFARKMAGRNEQPA
jgi:hypothetical protein